jgi:hypothetical protein
MSGFSARWLGLREPADLRARAPRLLAAVRAWAREAAGVSTAPLAIVDLGAGTGAGLRAIAPHLPTPQSWTLVDKDRDLLERSLAPVASGLAMEMLHRGEIHVRLHAADLASDAALADALPGATAEPCLFTASALLDLVSEPWCQHLILQIARPGVAVYAALSYDGRMALSPGHPLDGPVRGLFNRHQRRDKGFGPALGPEAARIFAGAARAAGARVCTARSDWRLGPGQTELIGALLRGWGEAAQEVAAEEAPNLRTGIAAWTALRLQQAEAGTLRLVVGHRDLFAVW